VGAHKYERSASRSGERNGYRERPWDTRVGSIELHIYRALAKPAAADAPLGAQLRVLVTIPGLGLTTAGALLASPPLDRLETPPLGRNGHLLAGRHITRRQRRIRPYDGHWGCLFHPLFGTLSVALRPGGLFSLDSAAAYCAAPAPWSTWRTDATPITVDSRASPPSTPSSISAANNQPPGST